MNQLINISVDISGTTTNPPLELEIWVDDALVHNIVPCDIVKTFSMEVDDEVDAEHELKFVLKNKTFEHTKIDEDGNILSDAIVIIDNLQFDNIKLGYVFNELATYTHNFNGAGKETTDEFSNIIGCNGSVVLKFTTPTYLWLLENM